MPTEQTRRVLVADDYAPWRRYIDSMFEGNPTFQIICQVANGLDAVEKAKELQPDLILLDIGLPGINGIEAARRLHEQVPNCKILFVSENRSADIAQEAMRTGAYGYVVKSDAAHELMRAARAVVKGQRFISACLAGHFFVATTLSTTQLSWVSLLISGIMNP